MRRTSKALSTVAAASALALLGGGVAFADNLQDDLITTAQQTQTIANGGSVTVSYFIGSNGNDGCNVDANNAATMATNVPAGVTATPSSLSFRACGVGASQSVTYGSSTAGTYSIRPTMSGGKQGNNGWNNNNATFTLVVDAPAAPADTTPPVVTVPGNITAEATSASGAVVTFSATAQDNVDGALTPTCIPPSDSTFALGTTTVTCSATDAANNTGSKSFTVTVVDTKEPFDITFSSTGVQDAGNYLRNSVPVAPTCTASDLVTADPTCVVTGYSSAAGTHTLTATATDAAKNVATATISYTVRTLTLSAFGSPVDGGGVLNTVKGGSTVPLKFTVFDESTERTDTAVVSSFLAMKVACPGGAPTEVLEEFATTGSTSLRYSDTQFIQNWKTPTGKGTCYRVTVTTVDGSTTSALFQLK
jgi:hypothetical protein